ncbi:MAG: hypothetical protein CFE21_00345 [Bacteroidetes bacterium B1(2017)]|nr:MAG: hypothetical protein CFE21_00345 [Bacteroidetes bacterium B1(2017)]
MQKSTSAKLFLIIAPLFIIIIFGMIWYNASYIQKMDKEYTELLGSANISSNALTQTTINTSMAMHKCYLMVLNDENLDWKLVLQTLDSIKSENSQLLVNLEKEAKTKEQKEKLNELINIRTKLILQRDSLVSIAHSTNSNKAKTYFLNNLVGNFSNFFQTSSQYLKLVQENTNLLSTKLTERNNTVKQINQYLFWLPIICLGLFASLVIVIFLRFYAITKDEVDY